MRGLLFAFAGFMSLAFHSCDSGRLKEDYEKTVALRPYETEVKGYLSEVFEVVDGSYSFLYKGSAHMGDGMMEVRLRAKGRGNSADYGLRDGDPGPLFITLCDSSGKAIPGFEDLASAERADLKLKGLMARTGDTATISFAFYMDRGRRLPETLARFLVRSEKMEEQTAAYDTTDWDYHRDWNQIINDFEQQVAEYASALKRAKDGDSVAMRDAPRFLNQVRGSEEILVTARHNRELSSAQVRRVIRIQDKWLDAEAWKEGVK